MTKKKIYFVSILTGSFFMFSSLISFAQNNIEEIKLLLKDGKYTRGKILIDKSNYD